MALVTVVTVQNASGLVYLDFIYIYNIYIIWVKIFIVTIVTTHQKTCLKEIEEKEDGSVSGIDAAGGSNPHVVAITHCSVFIDGAKSYVIVVTNSAIRTNSTQTHVVLVSDGAIFLDSTKSHVITVSDGSVIKDPANAHIIGIANCAV